MHTLASYAYAWGLIHCNYYCQLLYNSLAYFSVDYSRLGQVHHNEDSLGIGMVGDFLHTGCPSSHPTNNVKGIRKKHEKITRLSKGQESVYHFHLHLTCLMMYRKFWRSYGRYSTSSLTFRLSTTTCTVPPRTSWKHGRSTKTQSWQVKTAWVYCLLQWLNSCRLWHWLSPESNWCSHWYIWMLFNSISTRRNDNNSTKGLQSAYSQSVSPPGECRQSFCRQTDQSKTPTFFVSNFGLFSLYGTVLAGTFLKVIQLWGHIPSTERHKWRSTLKVQWDLKKPPYKKIRRPLAEKL